MRLKLLLFLLLAAVTALVAALLQEPPARAARPARTAVASPSTTAPPGRPPPVLDDAARKQAVTQVKDLPPEALPVLFAAVARDGDAAELVGLAWHADRLAGKDELFRELVPLLVRTADATDEAWTFACQGFLRAGPETAAAIAACGDPVVLAHALGPEHGAAWIVRLAETGAPEVRAVMYAKLRDTRLAAPLRAEAERVLQGALGVRDARARIDVIAALATRRDDHAALVEAVRPLLAADDPDVHRAAVFATFRLRTDDPGIAAAMRAAARSDDRAVQSAGLGYIARGRAPEDLAVLRAVYADRPERRASMLATFGAWGPAAAETLPEIRAALADDELAESAVRALHKVAWDPEPGLAAVRRLLPDGNRGLHLVRELGPDAAPLLPDVLALLRARPYAPEVRRALAALGPAAVTELRAGLFDGDARVRALYARQLGHLGATDARADLERLAGDPDETVRAAAAAALAALERRRDKE